MVATAGASVDGVKCVPQTTSQFVVNQMIATEGITADIRHYYWDRPAESVFAPDVLYLSYDLRPGTVRGARKVAGAPHYVMPGRIQFLPPGARVASRGVPGEVHALCLTIDRRRLADVLGAEFDERDANLNLESRRIEQDLQRIHEEVSRPGYGAAQLVEGLALNIGVELFRQARRPVASGHDKCRLADWRLRRLEDVIRSNLEALPPLSDLAERIGISPRHLVRTFKNTVGLTLTEFVAQARIDHAKRRLAQPRARLKDIAVECGFTSPAAFSTAFRRQTGLAPSLYRNQAETSST